MDITLPMVKVNGKTARGQAHIQPGINNWIGVCIVSSHLLNARSLKEKSVVIDYEGPFNCGEECMPGKGKAKVLHISPFKQKNQVIITVEGIEEPQIKKKWSKELTFSYNENLPVNLKTHKK